MNTTYDRALEYHQRWHVFYKRWCYTLVFVALLSAGLNLWMAHINNKHSAKIDELTQRIDAAETFLNKEFPTAEETK